MSEVGERELLAIIFTDAVDSTARTASDEEFFLKILLADLDYMRKEAVVRGGTVLKNTGDGLLISFKSAVDAVECALSIQQGFANRAGNVAFTHKIGVHIGDVIKKDGDIYGSGVNTASRLVAQCQAGGLCMSSTLYELVKQKSQIGTLKMTEFQLTNVEPPIKAFRLNLSNEWNQGKPSAFKKQLGSIQKQMMKAFFGIGFVVVVILGILSLPLSNEIKHRFKFPVKTQDTGLQQKQEAGTVYQKREEIAVKVSPAEEIIGTWQYQNGATTIFYQDGTIQQTWKGGGNVFGRFEKVNTKTYKLNFNNGQWNELVKIDKAGSQMEGKNNFGESVLAVKVDDAVELEPSHKDGQTLNGAYQDAAKNQPGLYYLRQIGEKVIWFGEEKEDNPNWSHIFVGEIQNNKIRGEYFDLPKGKSRFLGRMVVEVKPDGTLTVEGFVSDNQSTTPNFIRSLIRIPGK